MALKVKKRYPVPSRSRAYDVLPQRTRKREERRRSLRRVMTVLVIVGLLGLSGGVGYTWYIGKQPPVATQQPAAINTMRTVIKPPKIASDAAIGASVQTHTPEVRAGENASVSVRTNPAAHCTIVVKYGNAPATDSGLVPKEADEFGMVSWAWTIKAGTPAGMWPAEITCKNKKNSAFVKADIAVK